MRFHHLQVTAFGPFAATVDIDFEALNDAGVFLLTGPTGAGKTSILDAICFALFGAVPGARGVKTLRSDHAAPDVRPEVDLDFSVGERRFVVRRTPEWSRPKRRGTGYTQEKAGASLLETTTGEERLVSSRAQEVGHVLSDLLGMTASQFQQVVLLPQGEFQTFLRAGSQERHQVLQQLFRTARFEQIEEWVVNRTHELRERSEAGEATVRRLVATMADRAGQPAPEEFTGELLAVATADGRAEAWAAGLVAQARDNADEAAGSRRRAALQRQEAASAHDAATTLLQLLQRRDRSREALANAAADESIAAAAEALDEDQRASRCSAVLELMDEAGSRLAAAEVRRTAALARAELPDLRPDGGEGASAAAAARRTARELADRLTRLETLLPRERELERDRSALDPLTTRHARLLPQLADLRQRLDRLPERRDRLAASWRAADETASRGQLLKAELEQARVRAAAAARIPAVRKAVESARARALSAQQAYHDARERHLDIVARRLAGMAAELAGRLETGPACPVCGGTEHPHPAAPADDAVDAAAQTAAAAEVDSQRLLHETCREGLRRAELELRSVTEQAGGLGSVEADRAVARLVEGLAEVTRALGDAKALAADLEALDGEAGRLAAALRTAEAEEIEVRLEREALVSRVAALEAELEQATGRSGGSVRLLAESLRRQQDAVEVLAEAAAEWERCAVEVARLQVRADTEARTHGFPSGEAARSARLSAPERERLRRLVEEGAARRREAEAVLALPELQDLPEHPPDVAVTGHALLEATHLEDQAVRRDHLAQATLAALEGQLVSFHDAVAAWQPARDAYLTADSMSRLVRGIGSDNQLQMRLSAYVLATRLDQVLAAANERLGHMREQRYVLERTGEAARKGARAGLGLRVLDQWTGESRDPATLSGGETFVVSLALALGLSDVVSAESGGVQLDTLFVDEGFGMLDPDTLDDVMDRIDGLRAGGRTVGIVSHVTELRNRIPTQVHVSKDRTGSSVSVSTLVG